MVETIILGLDGANWNLLQPWLRAGNLPNIASLRKRGTAADLKSCLPPVTCPNWRCYSTGKNPGKLGVYWWENIDTEAQTLSTPTSRSFKSSNYWDYLADDGFSTGILNLPMTYPPLPMDDGFLVAGGPGSKQDSYTDPPDLGKELDERGYRVHSDLTVTSKSDFDAAEDVIQLIDERLETFRDLISEKDIDVAHCTVFYINVLQHFFWRSEHTAKAWEIIDEHIGAIRNAYPDATLFLMSDHGCQDINTMFYANSWLEQEGYLQLNKGVSSMLDRIGVNKTQIVGVTDQLGVTGIIEDYTPKYLKKIVPADKEGVKREQKLDQVDWENSQAIASGQGLIYILDNSEETRREIMNQLQSLESGITGTPITQSVHRREDIYDGPYVDDAPQIIFDQTPGIHTSGAVGNNPVFEKGSHWAAENIRTGLFLADGPEVVEEAPDEISITDVAPTILHQLGTAIPEDMDGTPLSLFDSPESGTQNPIVPDFVENRSDREVQDRLEDLGYLQ